MKRILATVGAFVATLVFFWISGMDLTERGAGVAFAILTAAYAGGLAYFYPTWPKCKKDL